MKNTLLSIILILQLTLISCKKDTGLNPSTPPISNEEELITTFVLHLQEDISQTTYEFKFKDIDGDGGNVPTIDNIILPANKSFSGQIILLDETKTPIDTISEEVKNEADSHQFFYEISTANLSHTYHPTDKDINGVPLGIMPTFTSGNSSTGTLRIQLKHQPEIKPTSGNGNSSLGETDIDITFNVTIQ